MSVKAPDLVRKGLHTSWDGGLSLHGEEVEPPGCRFPDNKGPPALPRALLRLYL